MPVALYPLVVQVAGFGVEIYPVGDLSAVFEPPGAQIAHVSDQFCARQCDYAWGRVGLHAPCADLPLAGVDGQGVGQPSFPER
jgi:hypothetical protein